MERAKIENWAAPPWHPDYGDVEGELQMLKRFCLALADDDPSFGLELEIIEPSYMRVNISRDSRKHAELWIVTGKPKTRYALFVVGDESEDEYYFQEVDKGIRHLKSSSF
jgi:hypothetical protein